jgi:hypothetical protein
VAGAFSKARAEQRTVLFVDESAFYLLPGVVRTYAPRGQTPTLRVPLTRDHLSAISAITPDGRLEKRFRIWVLKILKGTNVRHSCSDAFFGA